MAKSAKAGKIVWTVCNKNVELLFSVHIVLWFELLHCDAANIFLGKFSWVIIIILTLCTLPVKVLDQVDKTWHKIETVLNGALALTKEIY